MKNFENFEAFKMSKTQMNEITGGAEVYCYLNLNGRRKKRLSKTQVLKMHKLVQMQLGAKVRLYVKKS